MNLKQAYFDLLDELQTATGLTGTNSDGWDDVRFVGGDVEIEPPEVVVDADAFRLTNYNGANNLGGFTTDVNGDQTGWEYHRYYRVEAEVIVRAEDEVQKMDLTTNVQDHFASFEYDSSRFNSDTGEWEVGSVSPTNNPVVEPDWYEDSLTLSFILLERATETGDTLDTIQQPGPDDMVDLTLEDGETSVGGN